MSSLLAPMLGLARCYARNGKDEAGALPFDTFHPDGTSQTLGHDIEDDMQSQSGATRAAPRREEWLENLREVLFRDSLPGVRIADRHRVVPLQLSGYCNGSSLTFREAMNQGVHHEVGQYL